MQEEKVAVQIAAKALNVTPKTIHQWFRNGTLTRVKEGQRTYVLLDEIRALREKRSVTQKEKVINPEGSLKPGNNIVPVERSHYEGLLTRLGQLEAEKRYLLEYKEGLEARDKELLEAKVTLEEREKELVELRAKVKELSTPWWKKILKIEK